MNELPKLTYLQLHVACATCLQNLLKQEFVCATKRKLKHLFDVGPSIVRE